MLSPSPNVPVDLYQATASQSAFSWGMRTINLLVLLCMCISASAGDSDAVNERIPVHAWQMEEHWNIDCLVSWAKLEEASCAESAHLAETLKLCSIIYQPPGQASAHNCPDYREASRAINQQDCPKLRQILDDAAACNNGNGAPETTKSH